MKMHLLAALGASWPLLGRSWPLLGCSWPLFGCSWLLLAALGLLLAALEAPTCEKPDPAVNGKQHLKTLFVI